MLAGLSEWTVGQEALAVADAHGGRRGRRVQGVAGHVLAARGQLVGHVHLREVDLPPFVHALAVPVLVQVDQQHVFHVSLHHWVERPRPGSTAAVNYLSWGRPWTPTRPWRLSIAPTGVASSPPSSGSSGTSTSPRRPRRKRSRAGSTSGGTPGSPGLG